MHEFIQYLWTLLKKGYYGKLEITIEDGEVIYTTEKKGKKWEKKKNVKWENK